MLVIAENLNVRNAAYMEALKKKDRKAIEAMAKDLASSGADMINIQCSLDGSGDEEALPLATEAARRLERSRLLAAVPTLSVCPAILSFTSACDSM